MLLEKNKHVMKTGMDRSASRPTISWQYINCDHAKIFARTQLWVLCPITKEGQIINSSALSLWMPEVHLWDQYVEEDDAGVQSEAIILHRHHGAL
jgi:hypothetical protein